jgi:hypothetical protein
MHSRAPGELAGSSGPLHQLFRHMGSVDIAVHVGVQDIVATTQLPCTHSLACERTLCTHER